MVRTGAKSAAATRGTPIYEEIKLEIKERIASGALQPGDRVSSEQDLARELQVSRSQTRQALRDLDMEGYLVRQPGRGSFVAPTHRHGRGAQARTELRTVTMALPAGAIDRPSRHVRGMIQGFEERMKEHGYRAMVYRLDQDREAEVEFLSQAPDLGMSGVVLWPQFNSQEERTRVADLCEGGLPFVLLDTRYPEIDCNFAGTANRQAFADLTSALIARGHREIAFCARDFSDSVMQDRHAGYRSALARAGIARRDGLVLDFFLAGDSSEGAAARPDMGKPIDFFMAEDESYPLLKERVLGLLRQRPEVSAAVVTDDWSARRLEELLLAAGEEGRSLEMAVMDDALFPEDYDPRMGPRAIQNGHRVGQEAARLLLARISGAVALREQCFVPATLLGADTARHRSRDAHGREGGDA